MKTANKNQNGYVVLLAVILLSVLGAAVGVWLILFSLSFSQSDFAAWQSAQANALAGSCAESALNSLRQDAAYAGNETLTLSVGSCQILPIIQQSGTNTVQTEASFGGTTQRQLVQAQINAGSTTSVSVLSWQDVPSF